MNWNSREIPHRPALFFGTLIVLALSLGACRHNTKEQPTFSQDEMLNIMTDLCYAEAATSHLTGYPRDSLNQIYFKQVFDMHKTTLEQYEQNLRIYAEDVPTMEMLIKKLEARFEPEKKAPI